MFFKCLWNIIREVPYSIRSDSILLIIVFSVIICLYIIFDYKNILIYGSLKNSFIVALITIFYFVLFNIIYCMVIFLAPW